MKRKIVIYVIDSRYAAAGDTIDLRGKRGAARQVIGHVRDIRDWNYYNDNDLDAAPDSFKDPGDGCYTVAPTMMKSKHGAELKYIIKCVDFVTVNK